MRIKDYFYNINETAELLGVSRVTVWRWLKSGKVDGEVIGNSNLIPRWQVHLLKDNNNKSFRPSPPTPIDIDGMRERFLIKVGRQ